MAVTKTFELIDFLTADNNYSITATDLQNTTQVVTSTIDSLQYFLHKYPTRRYTVIRGSGTPTTTEARSDFSEDFTLWVKNRQHNIDKLYQAMFDYDYSPIENVDRYETETTNKDIATTYGRKDTESGTTGVSRSESVDESTTNDTALSGTDATTKSGNIVTENDRAGFNTPNSYSKAEKTTETYNNLRDSTSYGKEENGSGSLERDTSGTETTTHGKVNTLSGTDSTEDDTVRTLRVHGNIGVTSNVDLLTQEFDYRLRSLAETLLDEFINDYTYYS